VGLQNDIFEDGPWHEDTIQKRMLYAFKMGYKTDCSLLVGSETGEMEVRNGRARISLKICIFVLQLCFNKYLF
jgi:hypothetical protein